MVKNSEPEFVSVNGTIFFCPLEARGLQGKNLNPYCKVYLDKAKKFKTAILKSGDPAWKEQPRLIALREDHNVEKVVFSVWDRGILADCIGETEFKIKDLLDGIPRQDWYVLKNKKGTKQKGEVHCQIMFLDQGEDITPENDEFPYPLQTLMRKTKIHSWETLMQKEELPDLESFDRKGLTPLQVTAELGLVNCAKILIEKGAKVNNPNADGLTALHVAAIHNSDTIAFLVEKGGDVKVKDNEGNTPLHHAALSKNLATATILLENGADLNAQNKQGDTPFHLAIEKHAHDLIKLFSEKNGDIFVTNKAKEPVWQASLEAGKENETTQDLFFSCQKVKDDREFLLKKDFPFRAEAESTKGLKKDKWKENSQFAINVASPAKIGVLLYYEDPLSRATLPMEKTGFVLIESPQNSFKEGTYIQDDLPQYGATSPTMIDAVPETTYVVIPYPKPSDLPGKFHFVAYGEKEVTIKELQPWPFQKEFRGQWAGEEAAGCIEHPGWKNNPKYSLVIPPGSPSTLHILLEQERHGADIQPFQIQPYKYFIGFYVGDTSLENIDVQTKKWKNARETALHITLDGSKRTEYTIVPTAFKPGDELTYVLTVYYEDERIQISKK